MAKEEIKVGDAVYFYFSGTQPLKHGQVISIEEEEPKNCEVMVYSEKKVYTVPIARLKKE